MQLMPKSTFDIFMSVCILIGYMFVSLQGSLDTPAVTSLVELFVYMKTEEYFIEKKAAGLFSADKAMLKK